MAYKALEKLFYGDESVYIQTYKSRFDSEDTVKLDFLLSQHQAFFVQNTEVLKLAYEIVKLDKSVAALCAALPGVAQEQYSKKCLIDEIVLTNTIEGVHSSRKEIRDALEILEKQSSEKGERRRFVSVVQKYLKLLKREDIPLTTCQNIRDIYDELLLEEVLAENPQNKPDGEIFRKDMTAIHSATDKVLHKGLYPEREIIAAMEKALAFLHDNSVDQLWRICIFHYLIEYIHPFYDGNGRLGRFILSYCLSELLEPLLSYRISETIKENITAYYKAFTVCSNPHNLGDLTPFLIMMLRMIHTALKDLEESLHEKLLSWQKYEALASSFPEAANKGVRRLYSYLIQAALFSEKGISTKELRTYFQASYYIIKNLLDQVQPNLLLSQQKGKAKYYQINLEEIDSRLLETALHELHAGPPPC